MDAQPEPGAAAGLEHGLRDWSASNAPRSQNTSIQRACGAHASSISPQTSAHVVVGAVLVLGGQQVRAEERDVVGELGRELAQPLLAGDVERVAGLDLDVRDPGAQRVAAAGARQLAQLVGVARPGCCATVERMPPAA